MIGITLYIMACTTKNRVRRRLARLREPRYLIGAVVGTAYLYFAIFGRRRANRMRRGGGGAAAAASFFPALSASGPILGGTALLVAAAACWLMPFGSGLLDFTRAETEFLFPAPITRRQLLVYRLLRSQVAVLIASLIVALVYPVGSIAGRLRGLIGVWVCLMTCHVFFTGVTLWRQRRDAGARGRLIAAVPMLVTVGGLFALIGGLLAYAARQPVQTAGQALDALTAVAGSGLIRVVLIPFIALVQPLFAGTWQTFLAALLPALLVYLAVVGWVLTADSAFDRLTDDLVEQRADQPSTRRRPSYRARPVGWLLAPEGRAEPAFVWKSVLQTFRIVDRRILIRVLVIVLWAVVVVSLAGSGRGFVQVLGLLSALGAAVAVILGPQILRIDMRQDLQHLEVLKTWPVNAGAVVRGEMAWPVAIVTGIAWLLAIIALVLSASAFSRTSASLRLSVGIAGLIMAPAMVGAQFTVHNAVALLFPAWIASGQARPRGVDAMGQRLIMLGGTLLVVVLGLLPAALVGGVLWLAFARLVGPWILLPASLIGAVIVALEVFAASEALGAAYERLDLSSVERSE
jgi:hypothetical protein